MGGSVITFDWKLNRDARIFYVPFFLLRLFRFSMASSLKKARFSCIMYRSESKIIEHTKLAVITKVFSFNSIEKCNKKAGKCLLSLSFIDRSFSLFGESEASDHFGHFEDVQIDCSMTTCIKTRQIHAISKNRTTIDKLTKASKFILFITLLYFTLL